MQSKFDSFALELAGHFGWVGALQPSTVLRDELGADSLDMFELVQFLSEIKGDDIPLELVRELRTLGDLFALTESYSLGHVAS